MDKASYSPSPPKPRGTITTPTTTTPKKALDLQTPPELLARQNNSSDDDHDINQAKPTKPRSLKEIFLDALTDSGINDFILKNNQ